MLRPKFTFIFYFQGSKALGSNFIFHWPSATFSLHSKEVLQTAITQSVSDESAQDKMSKHLEKTTSALYAAANVWTDGVVLPQDTRKVSLQLLSPYFVSYDFG